MQGGRDVLRYSPNCFAAEDRLVRDGSFGLFERDMDWTAMPICSARRTTGAQRLRAPIARRVH